MWGVDNFWYFSSSLSLQLEIISVDFDDFWYSPSSLNPHFEFILLDFDHFWYFPFSLNLHLDVTLLDIEDFLIFDLSLNSHSQNILLVMDNLHYPPPSFLPPSQTYFPRYWYVSVLHLFSKLSPQKSFAIYP